MKSDNQETNKTNVSESVLTRIRDEQIAPRSKFWYVFDECLLWTTWLLSVFLGALALGVSFYVGMSMQYALYEVTHTNLFTFFLSSLPYVWLLILMFIAYLAVTHFKGTRRGYRYTTFAVLLSSLSLSVLGGAALYYGGLGYAIDNELGERMALYHSQSDARLSLWQAPSEGRLVGHLIPTTDTVSRDMEVYFEDIYGDRWQIDGSELRDADMQVLMNADRVRVLGTSTAPQMFHLCGVFAWPRMDLPSHASNAGYRRAFRDRLGELAKERQRSADALTSPELVRESVAEEVATFEAATFDNQAAGRSQRGLCADLAAVENFN